jgi:wyosine [tRNA(Phe)-imidazoG37] synthetase (radical SAM superfamily)
MAKPISTRGPSADKKTSVVSKTSEVSNLVVRDHRRTFQDNLYVYAVVSRRGKGVSIGVNLNPDKICNFDCVYCQVDRKTPGVVDTVDMNRLREELADMLDMVLTGELFEMERFRDTPPALRRLNDIAFSGDGEPTTFPDFLAAVKLAAEIKQTRGLANVKLVLITNATMFHKPQVREALDLLQANNGEIWAKLEAGTETYYQQVDRTTIPFQRVLDNITAQAQRAPLVIQAMFLRMHGQPPPRHELEAFCDRLKKITQAGGQIQLVQVYTVARVPAENYVSPLAKSEVDQIVELVRQRTGLVTEPFYGPDS